MDNLAKKLGFGLMRLPLRNSKIDLSETSSMIKKFIENGCSYFDTAPGYMDGNSEKVFGEITHDKFRRDEMVIATKLPAWDSRFVHSKKSAEIVFNNSLKNMKIDYFDNYLFHNMGEERNHFFDKYELWDLVYNKKKEGYIKSFGISFHDKANKLDEMLNNHPEIDFVQLQINCLDWLNPFVESKKCLEIANKYNKTIIIMEPLKGGILSNPQKDILEIINKRNDNPIQFAFDFVNSLQGCTLILSGMSSLQQVEENIEYFGNFKRFTLEEMHLLNEIDAKVKELEIVQCTSCRYCVNCCPNKICINEIINSLNIYEIHQSQVAFNKYYFQTRDNRGAKQCIKCGKCEKICPQHIEIRNYMQKACDIFEA